MESLPDGDILLKRSVVIPLNERWIHEPAMKKELLEADEWMRNNPPQATDLNALAAKLGIKLNAGVSCHFIAQSRCTPNPSLRILKIGKPMRKRTLPGSQNTP